MGICQSLNYEDEDEKFMRLRNKQHAEELRRFQQQIRMQKCFSELDMLGRGVSRSKNHSNQENACKIAHTLS